MILEVFIYKNPGELLYFLISVCFLFLLFLVFFLHFLLFWSLLLQIYFALERCIFLLGSTDCIFGKGKYSQQFQYHGNSKIFTVDISTLSPYFSFVKLLNIAGHYSIFIFLQSEATGIESPDYFHRWYFAIFKSL